MSKTRSVEELKPGDLLTKMECCALFCEKLRISRDSYYKYVRPKIKFKNVMDDLISYSDKLAEIERMPYTIAIGIINNLMNNKQPGDPSISDLYDYMKRY